MSEIRSTERKIGIAIGGAILLAVILTLYNDRAERRELAARPAAPAAEQTAETAAAPAASTAETAAAPAEAAETTTESSAETAEAPAEAAPVDIAAQLAALGGDAAAGETVFRKCAACHQIGPDARNRVGPQLTGLLGRTAGAVEGFRYSAAMAKAGEEGLVWTPDILFDYLVKPRDYVKGTSMAFAGLRSEDDRRNVIAYIAQFE